MSSETITRVSVIINNHNYGAFIKAAIDSVLNQSYPATEIIIVDDGSTDDSRTIIDSYGDLVTAVYQSQSGQAAALNAGFAASSGDLLCFLDSDDTWSSKKVEAVIGVFTSQRDVHWLRHKLQVCDHQLRPLGAVMPHFLGSRRIPPDRYRYYERLTTASTSALSMRRALAERLFPIPAAFSRSADAYLTVSAYDADAYLNTATADAMCFGYSLDADLGCYRRHAGQQFIGLNDLKRMTERQIRVAHDLQAILHPLYTPSIVFKHSLIISSLSGAPVLSSERLRAFAGGVRSVLTLGKGMRLMLAFGQLTKLLFAFLAPGLWIRHLTRKTRFNPS